jgi:hypothetical protein
LTRLLVQMAPIKNIGCSVSHLTCPGIICMTQHHDVCQRGTTSASDQHRRCNYLA